jgi:acyl-CoA thioesterase II
VARDGGTLSTRQVTARQDGQILLEVLSSFTSAVEAPEYQQPMPEVPEPESLPSSQQQLADYAEELGGYWVQPHPFDQRYIDPHPRVAVDLGEPSPRIRLWWKPVEPVPTDAALHSALLTYLSGTKMVETAVAMRRGTVASTFNALIDHALWFQRPVDLSDWVLSDQFSPSGVAGRGLATSTMYNRAGQLVCVATQELYFGRGPRS